MKNGFIELTRLNKATILINIKNITCLYTISKGTKISLVNEDDINVIEEYELIKKRLWGLVEEDF